MLHGCDRWIVLAAMAAPQVGPPRPTRKPERAPPTAEVEVRDAATGVALEGVTIVRALPQAGRHPGDSDALEFLVRDGVSPVRLQGTNSDSNESVWIAAKGHAWIRASLQFRTPATSGPERPVIELGPGGSVRLQWPAGVESPDSVPPLMRPKWLLQLLDEPAPDFPQDRERALAECLEQHAKGTGFVGWTREQVRHEVERLERRNAFERPPFVEGEASRSGPHLEHLPIGRWRATIRAPGRVSLASAEFTVTAGSDTVVEVATVRPRLVTGTVLVPEEWGADALSVLAHGRFEGGTEEMRTFAATRSADPARWTFDAGLAYSGPFDWSIDDSRFRDEQVSVPNLDEPIVLEAPPCAIVDVRVLDASSGQPVGVHAVRAMRWPSCTLPQPEAAAIPRAAPGEWEIRIPAVGRAAWIFEVVGEHEVLPPIPEADRLEKALAPAFPPGRSSYDLRVRRSRGIRLHVQFDGVEVPLRPEREHFFRVVDENGAIASPEYRCDAGGRGSLRLQHGGRFRIALFPDWDETVAQEVVVPEEGFVDVTWTPPIAWRTWFD